MTLGDVLALVAGVAASFFVIANLSFTPIIRSPTDQLLHVVLRFLQGVTLAISVVALSRVAVYRRMPSASEWLAILVGATLLSEWPWLRVDAWIYAYRWAFPTLDPLSYIGARWLAAGLFSAAMAIGLGSLRLGRQAFPTWLKAILLAWTALLALSGPLWVFAQHGADLISPSGGFGPGAAATLHRGVCLLAASLPMGVLFGLPAVAVAGERIAGRRWTWLEWASTSSSIMTGFAAMRTYRGEFTTPSPAWLAERALVLAWFVIVAITCRFVLIRFGEPCRRWVDGSDDQDRSSTSGSDSDASTL